MGPNVLSPIRRARGKRKKKKKEQRIKLAGLSRKNESSFNRQRSYCSGLNERENSNETIEPIVDKGSKFCRINSIQKRKSTQAKGAPNLAKLVIPLLLAICFPANCDLNSNTDEILEPTTTEKQQSFKNASLQVFNHTIESENQSNKTNYPPHGSKCLLAPLPLAQQQARPEEKSSINDYFNSIQLKPFKLKGSSTGGGSGALIGGGGGGSSGVFYVPTSNNSLRLFDSSLIEQPNMPSFVDSGSSKNLATIYNNSSLIAFGSICSGWRNNFQAKRYSKQPAYWVLDRRRAAFVAKFDFYSIEEFYDLLGHMAKLTSPLFRPVPPYHFQTESRYYNSCTISFRSYITLRAHLELYLLPVARASASQVARGQSSQKGRASVQGPSSQVGKHLSSPADQSQDSIRIVLLSKSDQRLAEQKGEQAAWKDNKFVLPNLDPNLRKTPFRLEFSAMPSIVKADSLQQHGFLNGVAIANFSMSPQCFGMGVDNTEWARLREQAQQDGGHFATGLWSNDGSNKFNDDLEPDNELANNEDQSIQMNLFHHLPFLSSLVDLNFIDRHKISLLFGVIFFLVAILFASQWLLCAYLRSASGQANGRAEARGATHFNGHHHYRRRHHQWRHTTQGESERKPNSGLQWLWWKVMDFLMPILCCICCGCAYICPRWRHRVYETKTEQQVNHSNGRLANRHNHLDSHELHRIQNNYLRPISASIFEDVELNINPNYISNNQQQQQSGPNNNLKAQRNSSSFNGQQQNYLNVGIRLPAHNPLKPYYIDRKRLTLTKPLGKGAFGEVYQGYLVCHCSDDGETLVNSGQNDDDSNESHSMKVAVKTLTDERMSEIDFVREAINMSLVSHRNIVELLGVCFEEKPLYIVMELMPGGNLKNFLLRNRDKNYSTNRGSSFKQQQQQLPQQQQQQQQEERVKLCMGDLLVFALDIARACDYLQKKQFIHRDLAARNCLLSSVSKGPNWQPQTNYIQTQTIFPNSHHNHSTASSSAPLIANEQSYQGRANMKSFGCSPPSALDVNANHKVDLDQVYVNGYANSSLVAKLADFGMTRDVYSNDYYRMGHKELPVRWMPPECLDGVATSKSDVWSFGVLLWELFSMGQLPYQQLLDNHQVIEFIKSRRHARTTTNDTNELLLVPANVDQPQEADLHRTGQQPALGNQTAPEVGGAAPEASPPLPAPHDNTPHPIYSIMCACWATNPEERPQFEEIANRLYWCLQMPDVLETSLPCFYEQQHSVQQMATNRHQLGRSSAEGNLHNTNLTRNQNQNRGTQICANKSEPESDRALKSAQLTQQEQPILIETNIEREKEEEDKEGVPLVSRQQQQAASMRSGLDEPTGRGEEEEQLLSLDGGSKAWWLQQTGNLDAHYHKH